MDELTEKFMSQLLNSNRDRKCTSLDIVYGGDHGQGSFKSGVKLVLRGDQKHIKSLQVGCIEVKKDTADILPQTLMVPRNEALYRILKGSAASGVTPDGKISVYDDISTDSIYCSFGETSNNALLLTIIPFRIFITRDLAFYAAVQGKESSTSNWCWLCQLSHSRWQSSQHYHGDLWTLQSIIETAAKVPPGGKPIMGVKTKPLIEHIGVDRYVCPPLHLLLGIGNRILDDFFEFVDKVNGLERLPSELINARNKLAQSDTELTRRKEALAVWSTVNGKSLATTRFERQVLNEWLREGWITNDKKAETIEYKTNLTNDIKELEKGKKELENSVQEQRKEVQTFQKALANEGKAVPKAQRMIQGKIEEILQKSGIDLAAYHGGDLTGNAVRHLMGKATALFSELSDLLKNEGNSRAFSTAKLAHIEKRYNAYRDFLVLSDGFFSHL
jgi:hypothetical protein